MSMSVGGQPEHKETRLASQSALSSWFCLSRHFAYICLICICQKDTKAYRKIVKGLEVSLRRQCISRNIPASIQGQIISCRFIPAEWMGQFGNQIENMPGIKMIVLIMIMNSVHIDQLRDDTQQRKAWICIPLRFSLFKRAQEYKLTQLVSDPFVIWNYFLFYY